MPCGGCRRQSQRRHIFVPRIRPQQRLRHLHQRELRRRERVALQRGRPGGGCQHLRQLHDPQFKGQDKRPAQQRLHGREHDHLRLRALRRDGGDRAGHGQLPLRDIVGRIRRGPAHGLHQGQPEVRARR